MMRQITIADWREIAAKFDSEATDCGGFTGSPGAHKITTGDMIGYFRPRGRGAKSKTMCADCWQAWKEEAAEERRAESENFWYR